MPPAFGGLRVAFVADNHHGSFVSHARVRATVDRVNALHPDLIVLGNHDHALPEANVAPVMAAAGIRALYDDGVWLRRDSARLRLSGLSGVTEDRQTVSDALDGATAAYASRRSRRRSMTIRTTRVSGHGAPET